MGGYERNRSLPKDLMILVKTVRAVLLAIGKHAFRIPVPFIRPGLSLRREMVP
jgi:hypothetical protein